MENSAAPTPELAVHPCQSSCLWAGTAQLRRDAEQRDLEVFRCSGCGSEWVRTEAWIPVDVDGVVPTDVAAERAKVR